MTTRPTGRRLAAKVYRARVAGLTKANAQTACRNLKAKRTDCLVLRIDNPLAMGN